MLALLWSVARATLRSIENLEAASRNVRRDISAGEAHVRICREQGIFHQARLVVIRIHRVGREVIGEDRIVRRQRRGHDLVDSYACPDRKSTRLNSSHLGISYAVFCLKKK